MNWREEQEQFWQWVTRPQNLADTEADINALFAAPAGLSRTAALNIYNNAYHQRLINISAELYPMLHRTLDQAAYTGLWLAYLEVHPPRPGSMSLLGEHLHEFVSEHSHYGKLPALLDIIALETAFIDCFERANEPAYSRLQLQAMHQDQWPFMRWQCKQDWVLINSRFDLEDYYRRLSAHFADDTVQPGSAPFGVNPLPEPATWLVRRQNQHMHFQRVTDTMAEFLRGIGRGDSFARLCETLAETRPQHTVPEVGLALLLQAIDWELLHAGD